MTGFDRRWFVSGAGALALGGCNTAQPDPQITATIPRRGRRGADVAAAPVSNAEMAAVAADPSAYQALYGSLGGEPFPVPAIRSGVIAPSFWRRDVAFPTNEAPGTIVVDPRRHYLYHVRGNGLARRYGVGVGRQGFAWAGTAEIRSKQEWPDWYPPKEMIERQPELQRTVSKLQSGLGVAGGPRNPLGARAMYLWQGNQDTLFRIHGTTDPGSIGRSVSSGCIRMANQDAIDLYANVALGSRVVVV